MIQNHETANVAKSVKSKEKSDLTFLFSALSISLKDTTENGFSGYVVL